MPHSPIVRLVVLGAALVLAWLPAGPARTADVHALVIGIDRYAAQGGSLSDLEGAVNDARDIASALRETGVASLRLLIDEDAHRDAVLDGWAQMKARARPGDTLLVTFAGHGAQEPARLPGSEADGLDEVMVLGGFRETRPHNYQRIFDYEWRQMVAAAEDFNVVLVFDACHSGTMNRALPDLGPGGVPVRRRSRFSAYGTIEDDMIPLPEMDPADIPAVLPHEVYVAATRDDLLVQEIVIDGEIRGALSHVFAQALRGAADRDGDGVLSRGELRAFVDARVRELSERRQFPSVLYSGGHDEPLFALPRATVGSRLACVEAALRTMPEQLPVALADAADAGWLAATVPGARARMDGRMDGSAVLTIDRARDAVFGGFGDLVAGMQPPPGVAAESHLRGIIDKWRALPALNSIAACQVPLSMGFRQGDGLHRAGSALSFELAPRDEPYLTLFNIAANGTVQFLYPLRPDGVTPLRDDPYAAFSDDPWFDPSLVFRIDFSVTPPFGGDHLVALASRRPMLELHRALRGLDGRKAAPEAVAELARAIAPDPDQHQIGVLALYTGP